MAAPTLVNEYEMTFSTSNAARVTPSFTTLAGDVLVVIAMFENNAEGATLSDTFPAAITYTLTQVTVANYTRLYMWTAPVVTGETGTISVAPSDSNFMGASVLHFRNTIGAGTAVKTNVASGAPTLNITTIVASSVIVVVNGDFNAVDGAARTWRTNAGSLTELTYIFNASFMTAYIGYHPDSGAIGTYAVGLSAPSGQKYSIIAVEIQGTGGGTPAPKLMAAQGVG